MSNDRIECHQCTFDEIKCFASAASKDHSNVKRVANDEWFRVTCGGELAGCGSILWLPHSTRPLKARLRGVYIQPDYRGKGCGSALTEYRLSVIEARASVISIEAYSTRPEFYVRHGFKKGSKNAHGYPLMTKELI